jgi:hypothetical protein
MGKWRYISTILNLGASWKQMISFTPRLLYLQDAMEERNISFSCREPNPDSSVVQPVTYSLYWQLCGAKCGFVYAIK